MITLNKLITTVLALMGLVALVLCMSSCTTTGTAPPTEGPDDWSHYYGPVSYTQ